MHFTSGEGDLSWSARHWLPPSGEWLVTRPALPQLFSPADDAVDQVSAGLRPPGGVLFSVDRGDFQRLEFLEDGLHRPFGISEEFRATNACEYPAHSFE